MMFARVCRERDLSTCGVLVVKNLLLLAMLLWGLQLLLWKGVSVERDGLVGCWNRVHWDGNLDILLRRNDGFEKP